MQPDRAIPFFASPELLVPSVAVAVCEPSSVHLRLIWPRNQSGQCIVSHGQASSRIISYACASFSRRLFSISLVLCFLASKSSTRSPRLSFNELMAARWHSHSHGHMNDVCLSSTMPNFARDAAVERQILDVERGKVPSPEQRASSASSPRSELGAM